MHHQLRLLLQADHDTWVCEISGWNGTRLTKEHIARMSDLLHDGFVSSTRVQGARKEAFQHNPSIKAHRQCG